jgi:hypothetical protein
MPTRLTFGVNAGVCSVSASGTEFCSISKRNKLL